MIFTITDEMDLISAFKAIKEEGVYPCKIEFLSGDELRTSKQQASIEIYCREMSKLLNNAGYEAKAVMEVMEADVPWHQALFKELIWRKIQVACGFPKSTKKLDTKQVSHVHKVLDRHLAANFGVSMAFPSRRG